MIRLLPALLAAVLATGAAARDIAETQVQVLEALARQDWAEAQSLWQPLAEAGEPEAEYQLGLLLATAPDPYRSRAGARDFLTRAADRGHREATYRLGLLLAGTGPADTAEAAAEALARFKAAAAAGHVLAASEVARREGKSPSFRFALPDPAAPRPPDSWTPQVVTRTPDPIPGRPDAVVRTFPMPAPTPPAPAVTVDPEALAPARPAPRPAAAAPAGGARIRVAVLHDAGSLSPFERDFRRKTDGWRDGLTLTRETDADGRTRLYLDRSLSPDAAQSLCRALKARQVDCVVVR